MTLLCTIPGVQQRTAEVLIAEIGVDMSAFPTAKHLASWAGVCPGNDESAGKRRSGKTRKGSKWLRANLTEAATAASRTKDTYLAAQYQRLRARRGHSKAITAVGALDARRRLAHAHHRRDLHTTPAATTTPATTPTATPDASSPTSKRSGTPSRCRKGPPPDPTRISLQILGHSLSRGQVLRGRCSLASVGGEGR